MIELVCVLGGVFAVQAIPRLEWVEAVLGSWGSGGEPRQGQRPVPRGQLRVERRLHG